MNRTLIRSLPIVARALGDKLGVKVFIGGSDAYTDGEAICLPSLPADGEEAAVLAYGYLEHEAGHVRETDFTVSLPEKPMHQVLANILEDVRIEAAMIRRYPGCRTDLADLVELLVNKGEFGQDDSDEEAVILASYVLAKARSGILGQEALAPKARTFQSKFEETFGRPALVKLDTLLKCVEGIQSTQESIDLAATIIEMLREEAQPPEKDNARTDGQQGQHGDGGNTGTDGQQSQDGDGGNTAADCQQGQVGDGGSAGTDSQQCQDGDGGNTAADCQQGQECDGGNTGTDGHQGQDGDGGNAGTNGQQGQHGDGCNTGADALQGRDGGAGQADADSAIEKALATDGTGLPKGIGEMAAEMLEHESSQTPWEQLVTVAGEDPSLLENGYGDHTILGHARACSRVLRGRLQAMVQEKCRTLPYRAGTGRRLDNRSLHRSAVGDPRIFRRLAEKVDVDAAVSILLDRSGSMARVIGMAATAALSVADALAGIERVSVSVDAFPGAGNTILPMLRFGEPVSRAAIRFGAIGASGGTPMAESLWAVVTRLALRPEQRKMVMVVTDGQPNNPVGVLNLVNQASAAGIDCIGIGIRVSTAHLFPYSCEISDVSELAARMYELVHSQMKRRLVAA